MRGSKMCESLGWMGQRSHVIEIKLRLVAKGPFFISILLKLFLNTASSQEQCHAKKMQFEGGILSKIQLQFGIVLGFENCVDFILILRSGNSLVRV